MVVGTQAHDMQKHAYVGACNILTYRSIVHTAVLYYFIRTKQSYMYKKRVAHICSGAYKHTCIRWCVESFMKHGCARTLRRGAASAGPGGRALVDRGRRARLRFGHGEKLEKLGGASGGDARAGGRSRADPRAGGGPPGSGTADSDGPLPAASDGRHPRA
jgi:hypothetical protein